MRRWYCLLVAALLATGCGGPATTPEGAPPASTTPGTATGPAASQAPPVRRAAARPEDMTLGGDMTLRFFENVLEADQPQRPTFEISSPRCAMTEENVWTLEEARATVYSKEREETRFFAAAAIFDQNAETASLSGGVTVEMGTQRVEIEDITWSNADRTARSSRPVTVTDGETRLSAAAMEFLADSQTLLLNQLTGVVALTAPEARPREAQDDEISYIDVAKGGVGELRDGRLQRISNGVEIRLRPSDPAAAPMTLAAGEITFAWPSDTPGGGRQPSQILLVGGVRVDGPQGIVNADRADLQMETDRLTFSGNVKGNSAEIDQFEADSIVYDLNANDSVMTNLRAPGVPLGEGAAPQSYSVMNIEQAANVSAAAGRVRAMTGGVTISLESASGPPLRLRASEVAFAWSEGESPKPTGIQMHGGVQVSGPQGDIRSERAHVDLAAQQFEFTGSVRGSLPDLESFTTDKLVYKPQSNDIRMTNLVAKGVPIAEAEAPDAAPKNEFTHLDIHKAPVVTLKNGRPDRMEGGIELALRSNAPDDLPLLLKAEQGTFTYGETGGRSPQRVVFTGNVDVAGSDLKIKCGEVDLDVAAGVLIFSENVAGSMEGVQDFTAARVTRNLDTGVTQTEGFTAKELDPNFTGPVERGPAR